MQVTTTRARIAIVALTLATLALRLWGIHATLPYFKEADAHIPLLHVYGEADTVVPWDENTGVVAERYRKLGGSIVLIPKPGKGHHPHGLEDPTPIVEFILKNAAPKP